MFFADMSEENPCEEDPTDVNSWCMDVLDEINTNKKALQTIKDKYIEDKDINWELYHTYKWTFKIENNQYYLKSVVLEK